MERTRVMHQPSPGHDHEPEGPGWLGVIVGGAAGVLLGLIVALVLGIGSTTKTTTRTVTRAAAPPSGGTVVTVTSTPDVVGQRLDVAKQRLRRAGFDVNVKGGGLLGVIVETNWMVVAQDPPGGNRLQRGSAVTLDIDRR